MEQNLDQMVYYMTLDLFIKSNGRDPNVDNRDLFPSGWNKIDDYRTKIDILSEAMNKKISIDKTERYLEYLNK